MCRWIANETLSAATHRGESSEGRRCLRVASALLGCWAILAAPASAQTGSVFSERRISDTTGVALHAPGLGWLQ
jgi:hypothetical protein